MSEKPTYAELEKRVQALAHVESELNRMKLKLIESEQHNNQFLAENSADVIYRMDIETGRYTYASPSVKKLLGYTVEEALTLRTQDYVTADSYALQQKKLNDALENHQTGPAIFELEAVRKDGRTLPVEVHVKLLQDENGNPVEVLGVARDITKRKQTEQSLIENKDYLDVLFNTTLSGTMVIDAETHEITDVNDTAAQAIGLPKEEIVGQVCHNFVCPAERGKCPIADLGQVVDKSERKLLRKNGDTREILKTVKPLNIGGRSYYIESFIDIGNLKRTEMELRNSEERFRSIFESTKDCILVWDRNYNYLYANQAAIDHVGTTRDKVIGMNMRDGLGHIPDFMHLWMARVDEVFAKEQTMRVEDAVPIGDHITYSESVLSPMKDATGEIFAVGVVYRDITKRKCAEKRLEKLNRLNEKLLISGSLDDKLKLITDEITDIFQSDFTRIWLTKPGDLCDSGCIHAATKNEDHICQKQGMCLHLISSSGRYTHIDSGHQRVPYGCYKIGRIASGEASKNVINDIASDSRIHDHEWADKLGLKSFAGYKLLSETGKPMGVLALFSQRSITPEEDALLEGIAASTAQVVQAERAKEALRANEQFLDAIIENIPDMIFVKDATSLRFARFNKAGEDLLGYAREDLYGKNDYDFFPKEEADFFIQKDREVLRKGAVLDIPEETIHTRKKGERILHTKKIPILDDQKQPRFLLGISEDITEKRQIEALQRFQAQIMSQIHDSVIAVDLDGIITSWNKGSQNLFDYNQDEVIGKHVSILYPEYFHNTLRNEIIPTLLAQESNEYETVLLRKSGEEFYAHVSLSVLKDEKGRINGMIGYSLDITEQNLARQALADSERRLADIIDFLPDPTWVIDNDGKVIAWNLAIEEVTGIEKKDVIGKGEHVYALPFYGERRPVLIDLVLKSDDQWENTYTNIKKHNGHILGGESYTPELNGGGRFLSGRAAKLFNSSGEVMGAIETLRDITDEKQSAEEREKLIDDLQNAIAEVKTLSGLLPICATCKKIRDDKGYWNQIESYFSKHSEVAFSHGMCPECMDNMYKDEEWYTLRNKK